MGTSAISGRESLACIIFRFLRRPLLLFLYERFRVALAIMAIPLLSLSAVFIGLWVSGIELNISALMGMTMIIGIVTEVAIFYFSEYQDLADEMEQPLAVAIISGLAVQLPLVLIVMPCCSRCCTVEPAALPEDMASVSRTARRLRCPSADQHYLERK